MNIDFTLFKESCEDRGYTRIKQENNNCVLDTNNGVKSEIKKRHYTFGWLRSPEELEIIKAEFLKEGYHLSTKHSDSKCVNILFDSSKDILTQFWALVDIVEAIDTIAVKERGQATKVFTREVDECDKFEKIAKRYFNAMTNQDQELLDIARNLLSGDTIDRFITRGESVSYTSENAYREHVVPCIMIHNEAIRMVLAKSCIAEVAQMIASNLAIVRITPDEAYKLDVELGLRTTMPEGWKFGDSIFARLTFAKIALR
jgi:hypothetical protein